jgi:hypothetical protein
MGIIGTAMGIIGTTMEIIGTTIGIIRNTFGIVRIGVITATDSGITTGDIGCMRTASTFFTRSTNGPAPSGLQAQAAEFSGYGGKFRASFATSSGVDWLRPPGRFADEL